MPNDHESRIAVLETRSDHQENTLSDVVTELKNISANVNEIKSDMRANRSFFAGIAFTFSLFGAVIGGMGSKAIDKLFS